MVVATFLQKMKKKGFRFQTVQKMPDGTSNMVGYTICNTRQGIRRLTMYFSYRGVQILCRLVDTTNQMPQILLETNRQDELEYIYKWVQEYIVTPVPQRA